MIPHKANSAARGTKKYLTDCVTYPSLHWAKLFGGLSVPQVVTGSLISVLSSHQSDIWSALTAFNWSPMSEVSSRSLSTGLWWSCWWSLRYREILRVVQHKDGLKMADCFELSCLAPQSGKVTVSPQASSQSGSSQPGSPPIRERVYLAQPAVAGTGTDISKISTI